MKRILLFGAGKSATVLIDYLAMEVQKEALHLTVVDANLEMVQQKLNGSSNCTAASFDIMDSEQRQHAIENADLVISLLPPALHILVARDCITAKKNLLTASYVDGYLKKLAPEIKKAGLLFLCEMGLDPGIDHMSAKKLIDEIENDNGNITSFVSHCGGLVAPESDDNPWHYKISWNPRNIVLAGKAGAVYKWKGHQKKLSYAELFSEKRFTDILGLEPLCWYPNRDSLSYIELYGLPDCETFIRTTLRHPDFISGWKNIIDLQLTDETLRYDAESKSLKALFKEHLLNHNLNERLEQFSSTKNSSDGVRTGNIHDATLTSKQLLFLGLDDDQTKMQEKLCSAADILQYGLEKKLALLKKDKDMVVMKHEIEFEQENKMYKQTSTLVVKGEDNNRTAMAKTVGLPLGIAARLILKGVIKNKGLCIPITKEIYEPVLAELYVHGIQFNDEKEALL